MTDTEILPANLKTVKELVYDPCGFELTHFNLQPESTAYQACSFCLNGKQVLYRNAHITPTKTGQFVAIWKRSSDGKTAPYDFTDPFDFMVIACKSSIHSGQFIFPKSVLAEKGIITRNGKGGIRGMRVYPPWDIVTNAQATKTKNWQTRYFLTISGDGLSDPELLRKTYASMLTE